MRALNLQRRFLLFFADYREAIERKQSNEEELVRLRCENTDLRAELAADRASALTRERELSDRMMRVNYGRRIEPPSATPVEPRSTAEQEITPRQAALNQRAAFAQQLNARREALLNGQQSESQPN